MAVSATAVWRVRAGGSNTNGGGYDAGISGAGTDYSQQNTAQASGTHGASSNTTTFVDATANAFTSAMVGNAIWIATGGGTVGAYFVTGYTSASTVTIDRAPGTVSAGSWKLGGAWADPLANIATSAYIVPGNKIFIRGAGTDTPAVDDYTLGSAAHAVLVSGDTTNGFIRFIGENGRPRISCDGLIWYNGTYCWFENLYLIATGETFNAYSMIGGMSYSALYNIVLDQNGYDIGLTGAVTVQMLGGTVHDCEVFSSVAPRGTQTQCAIEMGNYGCVVRNCNIHDTVAYGIIHTGGLGSITNTIFAKCRKDGLQVQFQDPRYTTTVSNCTFTANGGNGGIYIAAAGALEQLSITDCIFANHTGGSQAGIYYAGGGTVTQANGIATLWANNVFYNNTAHASGVNVPSGYNNVTGTNPFASGTAENYTPASAIAGTAMGLPINRYVGLSTATYASPGAAQLASGGGAATYVINRVTNTFITDGDSPYAP